MTIVYKKTSNFTGKNKRFMSGKARGVFATTVIGLFAMSKTRFTARNRPPSEPGGSDKVDWTLDIASPRWTPPPTGSDSAGGDKKKFIEHIYDGLDDIIFLIQDFYHNYILAMKPCFLTGSETLFRNNFIGIELVERDSFTVIVVSLLTFLLVLLFGLYLNKRGYLGLNSFTDVIRWIVYFNVLGAFLAQCFYIILESGYM